MKPLGLSPQMTTALFDAGGPLPEATPLVADLDGIPITEEQLREWERARVFCAARLSDRRILTIAGACEWARAVLDLAAAARRGGGS